MDNRVHCPDESDVFATRPAAIGGGCGLHFASAYFRADPARKVGRKSPEILAAGRYRALSMLQCFTPISSFFFHSNL